MLNFIRYTMKHKKNGIIIDNLVFVVTERDHGTSNEPLLVLITNNFQ